jgi:hypothetical protein
VSLQRGERSISPTPPFSYLDYRDLREQNHTFTGILAYHHDWITLTGGTQPERAYIANVTANYFDVLGIKPALGRFFLAEEEVQDCRVVTRKLTSRRPDEGLGSRRDCDV